MGTDRAAAILRRARQIAAGTASQLARALLYALAGGLVVGVTALVVHLEGRPDLSVWHTADLDEEFRRDAGIETFEQYLAQEARLFRELDEKVHARIEEADRRLINRFHRGSLSDPSRWDRDWNRTFELSAEHATAGVLLLHGMSDSPYSMRSLGETLHRSGAHVVGLRLPGHGTAPAGLLRVEWEDMAAAVRLAADHLRERVGDRPLFLVGYSNGGALAVHHALVAIDDAEQRAPDGLVLISPEIGISGLAALASWQRRLGRLLLLEKLGWNSIRPEYDPFKYQSFALNAAEQAYRLTRQLQRDLDRAARAGRLGAAPPVLAFQSIVDATVSAPALVEQLFARLPARGHELVLFDVNRYIEIQPVLVADPGREVSRLLAATGQDFTVTLVTNRSAEQAAVVARRRGPGSDSETVADLGASWPAGVYSLSHVALPFPPADPLYGERPVADDRIHLGRLAIYGERGLLEVPDSEILRQRWNPFHGYMVDRTLDFLGLQDP